MPPLAKTRSSVADSPEENLLDQTPLTRTCFFSLT
jgi:hypothetical protein